MMKGPPEPPTAMAVAPPRVTMVGVMLLVGRFPGATWLASDPTRPKTFGTPGAAEKSSIVLLRITPDLPPTTCEPKAVLMLVVQATAFPTMSMIERCAVPRSEPVMWVP